MFFTDTFFPHRNCLKHNHKIISDSEETGACIRACVFNLQSLTKTVVLQQERFGLFTRGILDTEPKPLGKFSRQEIHVS